MVKGVNKVFEAVFVRLCGVLLMMLGVLGDCAPSPKLVV